MSFYDIPSVPELYCTNLEETLAFYCGVLGFSTLYIRPEDRFARLERQGSEFMFEELNVENGRKWLTGALERPFGRGISFQIDTTDVEDLYARVQSENATVFLPIEEKWYRADDKYFGCRQFIVQDPDGYLLRFAEDLGERENPA